MRNADNIAQKSSGFEELKKKVAKEYNSEADLTNLESSEVEKISLKKSQQHEVIGWICFLNEIPLTVEFSSGDSAPDLIVKTNDKHYIVEITAADKIIYRQDLYNSWKTIKKAYTGNDCSSMLCVNPTKLPKFLSEHVELLKPKYQKKDLEKITEKALKKILLFYYLNGLFNEEIKNLKIDECVKIFDEFFSIKDDKNFVNVAENYREQLDKLSKEKRANLLEKYPEILPEDLNRNFLCGHLKKLLDKTLDYFTSSNNDIELIAIQSMLNISNGINGYTKDGINGYTKDYIKNCKIENIIANDLSVITNNDDFEGICQLILDAIERKCKKKYKCCEEEIEHEKILIINYHPSRSPCESDLENFYDKLKNKVTDFLKNHDTCGFSSIYLHAFLKYHVLKIDLIPFSKKIG